MAEATQNLIDDFFGPNRDVVTQLGNRIGLLENFANDYRVNLDALRLQYRNQGHHRPVNNLDVETRCKSGSTTRRNHNFCELESLNLIIQSLRAENNTVPALQYAVSRELDLLFVTLSR